MLSCCACDNVDKTEDTFAQAQQGQPDGKGGRGAGGGAGSAAAQAGQAVAPEKSRVQEFVKDFAKCAVRGVPCQLIDGETGKKHDIAYFIDAPLQRLTLRNDQGADYPPPRELLIAGIQDIADLETTKASAKGRGAPVLTNALLMDPEQDVLRDRLVVLSLEGGQQAAFVLENSSVDRDRFIMCMKVLRLYAQTHGQEGAS